MSLDLWGTIDPKTLTGIKSQQTLHEVACFGGKLNPVLVPFNLSGKNVFEDLLRCFGVERGYAV
jgi:hypothetical protein